MIDIRFGMLHTRLAFEADQAVECYDEKCNRIIMYGQSCFIDTLNDGRIYCDNCGKCIRYSRKKEQQRLNPSVNGD